MNYETRPPRISENLGTQNSTPTGWGSGVDSQPPTHPPTHPPKQNTRHEHWTNFRTFRNFVAYEQSIQCHHYLSHMINRRSLSHLKSFLKVSCIELTLTKFFHTVPRNGD